MQTEVQLQAAERDPIFADHVAWVDDREDRPQDLSGVFHWAKFWLNPAVQIIDLQQLHLLSSQKNCADVPI